MKWAYKYAYQSVGSHSLASIFASLKINGWKCKRAKNMTGKTPMSNWSVPVKTGMWKVYLCIIIVRFHYSSSFDNSKNRRQKRKKRGIMPRFAIMQSFLSGESRWVFVFCNRYVIICCRFSGIFIFICASLHTSFNLQNLISATQSENRDKKQ